MVFMEDGVPWLISRDGGLSCIRAGLMQCSHGIPGNARSVCEQSTLKIHKCSSFSTLHWKESLQVIL